jgi:hypothetical protein
MAEHGTSSPGGVLPFLVAIDDEPATDGTGTMGIFSRGDDLSVRQVSVDVLRRNLHSAVAGMRALLEDVAGTDGQWRLTEAQLSFEVTASGGVAFLGATTQVAGSGGITLTFSK